MFEKSCPITLTLSRAHKESCKYLARANSWTLIFEYASTSLLLSESPSPRLAINSIAADTPAQAA